MGKILLVDDDGDWRALWRGALETAGHDVLESPSGDEALACLREQAVDLVLLDLTMPETSGWDVLQQVWTAEPAAPPIVVVTSIADESSELRARELGAVAYIAKPVDTDDLVALVGRVLHA